jgi:hypothetical protein
MFFTKQAVFDKLKIYDSNMQAEILKYMSLYDLYKCFGTIPTRSEWSELRYKNYNNFLEILELLLTNTTTDTIDTIIAESVSIVVCIPNTNALPALPPLLLSIIAGDAARRGHMNIVREMIRRGEPTNWVMCCAAHGGHMNIVQEMIRQGATHFRAAMERALEAGHMDIVQEMIRCSRRYHGLDKHKKQK